jgi:signal peptidase I
MAVTNKKTGFLASVREFIGLLLIVFLIRTFGFGLYQVPSGSMETTMLVGERFFADKLTYLFSKPQRGDIIALNDPTYKYSENPFVNLFQNYVWGPPNWTKRVIGIPGDHVQGVIEDGKPVVYLNGQKLDEPYLNKYPIVYAWKKDRAELIQEAQREIIQQWGSRIDAETLMQLAERKIVNQITPKSFDMSLPFDSNKQPFYQVAPDRIVFIDGAPLVLEPGTVSSPKNSDEFSVVLRDGEYWCMGDNRLGSSDSRVIGAFPGKLIHGKIRLRIWSMDTDESWWIVDLVKHPINFFKRIRFNRFFQIVR